MIFKVGDTVVYPHHGAALIEAIETRTIKGVQKEYLVLKVAQGDLTVRVPAENAEYVGVRDVVGQEGLDKVFQVLRAPHTEEPTNWTSGVATRSAGCRPARSACWPRPVRFWWANLLLLRTPTT
jgi:RNA polymerase-interacting CarD/CdnL/TRCF family regulator